MDKHAAKLNEAAAKNWQQAYAGYGGSATLRDVLVENHVPDDRIDILLSSLHILHDTAFKEGAAFAAEELERIYRTRRN